MDESTLERIAAAIAAEVRRQLEAEARPQPTEPPPAPRKRLFIILGDGEVPPQRLAELEQLRTEPVEVTVLLCDSLLRPEVARARLPFARFLTCADAQNPLPWMESHDLFLLPQVGRRRLVELVELTTTCGGNGVILEALAAGKPVYAVEGGFTELLARWRARGTAAGRALAERLERWQKEWSQLGVTWLPEGQWLPLLRQVWSGEVPTAKVQGGGTGRGRPLITAADVEAVPAGGELILPPQAIVTPLAWDVARQRGVRLRFAP